MLEIYILLMVMIIGAIVAVEIKDILSSVIAVGTVGLGISIAFLILQAPDLAIVQLVVEILCVIILIRGTLKKDLPFSTSGRWLSNSFIAIAFIILFLIISLKCFKDLPPFGSPIMRVSETYLKEGLSKTGAPNIVSAIILDFRGYDTLGEATILFTAVIGSLAVLRKIGRKKENEKVEDSDD